MSSTSFTVLRCDRCGREAEIRAADDRLGWGLVMARGTADAGREQLIGPRDAADDICPGCSAELFAWWSAGTPSEPPPPAPKPRPAFTPESRAAAVAHAVEVLHDQVEEAIAALRDRPTSLITGEAVPGATAGIADRATQLVYFIVGQTTRKRRR